MFGQTGVVCDQVLPRQVQLYALAVKYIACERQTDIGTDSGQYDEDKEHKQPIGPPIGLARTAAQLLDQIGGILAAAELGPAGGQIGMLAIKVRTFIPFGIGLVVGCWRQYTFLQWDNHEGYNVPASRN